MNERPNQDENVDLSELAADLFDAPPPVKKAKSVVPTPEQEEAALTTLFAKPFQQPVQQVAPVPAVVETTAVAVPHEEGLWGMDPAQFKRQLEIADTNRKALLLWLKDSMVEGTDFGKIHVMKKDKCDKGIYCDNPKHFAKPSLWKPGAEKIFGKMNLRPDIPEEDINKYMEASIGGIDLKAIILKCVVYNASGQKVGTGVGARSLTQDYGDINKSFKMAKKSAIIDACLTTAGLSEIFTQDLEDMIDDKPVAIQVQAPQQAAVFIQAAPVAPAPRPVAPPPPQGNNRITPKQNSCIWAIIYAVASEAGTDTHTADGKAEVKSFVDFLFGGSYSSAAYKDASIFIGQYAQQKNQADLLNIYNTFKEARGK